MDSSFEAKKEYNLEMIFKANRFIPESNGDGHRNELNLYNI